MKALVTADWHLSNTLPYAQRKSDDLISDRLKDIEKTLGWIIESAIDRSLPLIVLGDVFDRRKPDAVTLKTAAKIFQTAAKAGLKIYILPGNHDAHDTRGLHYVVEAFGLAEFDGLTILQSGRIEEVDKALLCPVPYQSLDSTLELIQAYREHKSKQPKILLLHDTIKGSSLVGGYEAEEGIPKEELEGFEYVLAGHLHGFQKLSPIKGVYVGSPYQINFNEVKNTPTIGMLTTEGRKVSFHRVSVPDKLARWFGETIVKEDGEQRSAGAQDPKYFRLIYEGDGDSISIHDEIIKKILAERKKKARHVSFINRGHVSTGQSRLDIDIITDGMPSFETLISEYVKLHCEKDEAEYIQTGLGILEAT